MDMNHRRLRKLESEHQDLLRDIRQLKRKAEALVHARARYSSAHVKQKYQTRLAAVHRNLHKLETAKGLQETELARLRNLKR
ncbi:hypothetical protein ACFO4L_08320 [Bacillus daqingensis]|uniref:Transposase n=1 Tax=Bacillus daqingensis TaxID=872396 RepID=A0ABV9NWT7_9BACI